MPEPQARALSVLKSILLSQGQSINHDNALYLGNYYFYFIEGADVPFAMLAYIDNCTISERYVAFYKRDATLKLRAVINMDFFNAY